MASPVRRLHRLFACLLAASAAATATAQETPVARRDRVVVVENSAPVDVDVIANDAVAPAQLVGGQLLVSSPPMGSVSVVDGGTASAGDDRLRYQPPTDFSGIDVFSYQVCTAADGCDESQLEVVVRPAIDVNHTAFADSGYVDVPLSGLRALPALTLRTTPLRAPDSVALDLATDPSPRDLWDLAGTQRVVRTLPQPADGNPQEWQVLIDAIGWGGDVDLYAGQDLNGNGLPDPGEVDCTSAMAASERCELNLIHPGNGDVRYWVLVHNRHDAAQTGELDLYAFNLGANGDASLVATAPGTLPADAAFPLRVSWNGATLVDDGLRAAGYVGLWSEGNLVGRFPFRVERSGEAFAPRPLVGNLDLVLPPDRIHEALFVDVPAGATSLTVRSFSSRNIDLYLAHAADPSGPVVAPAPPRAEADASATTAAGNEVIRLTGAALKPGRWYVIPHNADTLTASVVLQATIEANPPAIRPGSYFDPGRGGHGVFLYPAGSQWTGLWFTYLQDGSPTWYYLQGAAPGANGLWFGELFRSAWDGGGNRLTRIGLARLSPSGTDAFTWTWTIDGETGSEPMVALGRGCPVLEGEPLDVSSTWFAAESAGTGHSVQMWPHYEYYAAFIYDDRGVARFVTSEAAGFQGGEATLAVEQLTGFCPLCERPGAPQRSAIGTLTRRFLGGETRMALTLDFTGGLSGHWQADEIVQPLGGPASTQGCAP
ncbi:Ig-like domain-containing protein [Arenimonas composti]|uniref:Uncharacterized protein n=1 Tax=Arenimonas composti TR7-09 = DSM 18010 TaxID=1121013 RepID=A0A091C2R0_9GAMM|nr:Ig-like domain-containing protein [Arenimonas composti]KFN50900.1 hypothetical protein P873_00700 [Arenimonas composti TR7-09 = DSM 18010]